MTKSAVHKVYYQFTFTVKVVEDAVSFFSDITRKTAWMYNLYAAQVSREFKYEIT